MTFPVLAAVAASVTELKRDPMGTSREGHGETVTNRLFTPYRLPAIKPCSNCLMTYGWPKSYVLARAVKLSR